ncbi:MAG: DUF3164 family protein [Bacteroides sp.]|nr:DUF3164 family protein [Bacteroides sp.]
MSDEKKTVEMTPEELARYEQFKEAEAKKEAAQRAKENREAYRKLVDEEIDRAIPQLQELSQQIQDKKAKVLGDFQSILTMKSEVMGISKDNQRSHTFTNSEGTKRITLGVYQTDGYSDTVDAGIAKVQQYLESLASNMETKTLVRMVLKLLARDAKGTLKASRVLQLRKMAEESGSDLFLEGVKIIEESYQPAISRQFIRAEKKNENGAWVPIPLGMTEA